jgi:hypothetical protein
MYVARANEEAGRLAAARAGYEQMMRRLLDCWTLTPSPEQYATFDGARTFLYLAQKLDREHERAASLEAWMAYRPNTRRLG